MTSTRGRPYPPAMRHAMRHALTLLAVLLAGCGSVEPPLPPQDDAARAVEDLAAADAPPAPEDRPVAPVDAAREDAPPVLDAVAVDVLDAGHLADDHPTRDTPPAEVAVDAGPDCTTCYRAGALARCDPARGCVIDACREGFADCNGFDPDGCETDLSALDTCGRCGVRCAPRQRCFVTRTSDGRWAALCVTP